MKDLMGYQGLVTKWEEMYEAFTSPYYNVTKKPDAVKGLRQCIDELAEVIARNVQPSPTAICPCVQGDSGECDQHRSPIYDDAEPEGDYVGIGRNGPTPRPVQQPDSKLRQAVELFLRRCGTVNDTDFALAINDLKGAL